MNMALDNNLNRLKVALCENGKTSKWLADQLGVNPATVSKWCTNKIQPDLHTLDKVAEMLGIDITELLNSRNKRG
jgi:transcriptional regulator with XRE-family HTH domain